MYIRYLKCLYKGEGSTESILLMLLPFYIYDTAFTFDISGLCNMFITLHFFLIKKREKGIQLQIRAGPLESDKNSAAQRRCQAWFALNIRLLMHRWWMPKSSGKWGAREISKYREMMYGRLAGWQLSGYLNRGGWDPCQANYLQPSPHHFCVTPDQGQIWNTILTWH